ncbi:MAG TPA: NUDIX hydrolase [Methylophilaceae bacterium]|nr:NUDIX hydrolase [Methylophilaceae bacterium]
MEKEVEVNLTETRISSEAVFDGKLLHARRDKVQLPNGEEAIREYIVHPGAVLVIPVLFDGQLVFERQFRYPLDRAFIELPAGKIDPNEDPLVTGQRELLEETGYTATQWEFVTTLHPCIGYSSEAIHIYLAKELSLGMHSRDEEEFLEIFTMSLPEAMEAMHRGEITDGKTMIALFWAHTWLQQKLG